MKNKTSIYTEIPSQAFEAVKAGEWSLKEFEEYIEYVEERAIELSDGFFDWTLNIWDFLWLLIKKNFLTKSFFW